MPQTIQLIKLRRVKKQVSLWTINLYTTFIMADRSGGVVTNCIRARQVRPLSPNPRSGRVEKYSKFVRVVKFCSLVFVSSA